MPIPRPKPGEKQRVFIERCMLKISKEYGTKKSLAICYDIYKKEK
jgi:hypothetical protein|tara:strand:+ start:1903 stop:2037 length:135 start_codon:yes stop_codon:yes gene_type:complete